MFTKRGNLFTMVLFLCLAFVPLHASAAEAPSYALSLSSKEVEVGSQIRVSVVGEHVSDLFGYEIQVTYDPTQLRFVKATSPMNGFTVPAIVKDGHISFAHTKVGNLPGDSGSLELASITFESLKEGKADIKLAQVKEVSSQMIAATILSDSKLALDMKMKAQDLPVTFSDITNHWAQKAIERAASLGFVNGYEDGSFQPDGQITRAELTAMLVRALPLTNKDAAIYSFSDLNEIPQWAKSYVFEAASAGVITGYEDHSFGADRLISRAEIAVMVARAIGLKGISDGAAQFADGDQIPDWAQKEVAAARKAGLIQGRDLNYFAPADHATRAEAATLILAAYDFVLHK